MHLKDNLFLFVGLDHTHPDLKTNYVSLLEYEENTIIATRFSGCSLGATFCLDIYQLMILHLLSIRTTSLSTTGMAARW